MQYGEIIELGRHKLMCGDSTNPDDMAKLMQTDHAKILFTSPPYSNIRDYKGADISIEHLVNFIPVTKDYADVVCVNLGILRKNWEIIQYWDEYIKKAKECGLKLLSWNVWDKIQPGSIFQQKAMFPLHHEFIFIFGKKAYKLNRTIPKKAPQRNTLLGTGRRTDGSIEKRYAKRKINEPNKQLGTVISLYAELGPIRLKHPAVMPVQLPVEYIKAMTNEGDFVLEPFAGSGTTLIACEQTGRKCLAMEISEEYCDVIIERYREFKKAEEATSATNATTEESKEVRP